MAIIVPDKPFTRTKGELEVINCLKIGLPDSWYVYYEALIDGYRPDLILFSEYYGILVLEIKDYLESTIKFISPDYWTIQMDREIRQDSPIKQVSEYAFKIINLLSSNHLLVHQNGSFLGRLVFPVLYACVFTRLTSKQIEDMNITSVIPVNSLITKEDLFEGNIALRIENIFKKTFSISALGSELGTVIRQLLYPQIHNNKDGLRRLQEVVPIKSFLDFVDEILFISTEIRHIRRTRKIEFNEIAIIYPNNRLMKKENLVYNLQTVLSDMEINSSNQVEEEKNVRIYQLDEHFDRNHQVLFFIDCNEIHSDNEKEALLAKIASNASSDIYLTSNGNLKNG